MKRLLPILLLAAVAARSEHRVYYSPEELKANDYLIAVDSTADGIIIEARCALPRNKERAGSNTQWWGIAWNNDADSLILQGRNTAYGDFTDMPVIDLIHRHNGTEQCLGSVDESVNLPSGAHTLSLEWTADGQTAVAAGAKHLTTTALTRLPRPCGGSARIIASPGAEPEIASAVTEFTDNPARKLAAPFDASAIDSLIASSALPIAGYWKYLDRATDDDRARAGGKYTLAVVPYGGEILLIYIEGARILADSWTRGMKKGILRKTPFMNHYDLTWYGSEMTAIDDECHAAFDSEGVMTCTFPLHESQLRFYKVP